MAWFRDKYLKDKKRQGDNSARYSLAAPLAEQLSHSIIYVALLFWDNLS